MTKRDSVPGQLSPFPLYRVKETGERFRHLGEAAKSVGEVTYDPSHVLHRKPTEALSELHLAWAASLLAGNFSTTTMFREIETVLPDYDEQAAGLLSRRPGSGVVEMGDLADTLVHEMVEHVVATFPESGLLCVPHSAGHDSRLVSLIVKEACARIGGDSRSRVRFACWEPELSIFLDIMEWQGWGDENVVSVRDLGVDGDYYGCAFDFAEVGSRSSESVRYWPGNIAGALALECDPASASGVYGMSGVWGDVIWKWSNSTRKPESVLCANLAYLMASYVLDSPTLWPGHTEPDVFPHLCTGVLDRLSEVVVPDVPRKEYKLALISVLDPAMADERRFPNPRADIMAVVKRNGHMDQQVLSAETVSRMQRSYDQSWYSKVAMLDRIEFTSPFEYDGIQSKHYIRAAICEWLIGEGVAVL